MPRYRLHEKAFIDRTLHKAGAVIATDGAPGSYMEPLDDDGWLAVHADIELRRRRGLSPLRYSFPLREKPEVQQPSAVDIPDDWRERTPMQRIALARKLGAPAATKAQQADEMIEAELAKRHPAPQENVNGQ